MFAVPPEQEQREGRHHKCHRQSRRFEEDVKAEDVHNYRSKQRQAERHEPAGEQQRSADNFQSADDVEVMADGQRRYEIPSRAFGGRRLRHEIEEDVQAEDDEHESE